MKKTYFALAVLVLGALIMGCTVQNRNPATASVERSNSSNPGPVSLGPKTNAAQGDFEQTLKLLDAADKASNKYNFNNSSDRAAFELEMYNLIKQGQYIDLLYKGNAVMLNPTSRTDSVRRIEK